MSKKRILVFSMMYEPFIGGAEVALKEITNRISPQDYEFDLITLRLNSKLPRFELMGNVNVHRIGFTKQDATIDSLSAWPLKINKFAYPFTSYLMALRLRMRHKYDGMWCMLAYHAALGAILYKLTFLKTPYLLELQDGRSYEEREAMFGKLFWWLRLSFKKADYVKCISSFLMDVTRRMGAQVEPKLIPNGVSVAHFSQNFNPEELQRMREKLDLKENITYVVTATRLVERRGLDAMIEGLKYLPENVHYLLCGTGPYEQELRKMAERDKTAERIVWVGHVDYTEVPKYLALANIFARPSVFEGMGNAFVEAMTAGLPTVATPVGGIVDFLFEAPLNPHPSGLQTGYLCEAENPESFAQAIKRVLENPEKATQVAQAGKTFASNGYEWDNIARNHKEQIFDKM